MGRCIIAHTYLHFKAQSSDMGEYMDLGLPTPASIQKWNIGYSICWLVDGYFGTKAGKEYLNDIIARLFITMPSIQERLLFEPREYDPKQIHRLRDFWMLKEKAKKYKVGLVGLTHNSVGKDAIFIALKVWVELRIKEQGEGRTVPYSLLESFAFSMFHDKAKDKSTLRAKCRSVWEWYDNRGWKNTKYLNYQKKDKEEVLATRQEHAKKLAQQKTIKNKRAVWEAIHGLEKEEFKMANGSWNASAIARSRNITVKTVRKYLKELGER